MNGLKPVKMSGLIRIWLILLRFFRFADKTPLSVLKSHRESQLPPNFVRWWGIMSAPVILLVKIISLVLRILVLNIHFRLKMKKFLKRRMRNSKEKRKNMNKIFNLTNNLRKNYQKIFLRQTWYNLLSSSSLWQ